MCNTRRVTSNHSVAIHLESNMTVSQIMENAEYQEQDTDKILTMLKRMVTEPDPDDLGDPLDNVYYE